MTDGSSGPDTDEGLLSLIEYATVLGKLVETWFGILFEEYLQQHLFALLAINSTLFWAEMKTRTDSCTPSFGNKE